MPQLFLTCHPSIQQPLYDFDKFPFDCLYLYDYLEVQKVHFSLQYFIFLILLSFAVYLTNNINNPWNLFWFLKSIRLKKSNFAHQKLLCRHILLIMPAKNMVIFQHNKWYVILAVTSEFKYQTRHSISAEDPGTKTNHTYYTYKNEFHFHIFLSLLSLIPPCYTYILSLHLAIILSSAKQ